MHRCHPMPMARSEHETEAEVTFTEPGSLGLRLVDNERDGAIELLALNDIVVVARLVH